jgi:membrane protein required for colicin V production
MLIDVIALALLCIAINKGIKHGFIKAVISFFIVGIGLWAALKFSSFTTGFLQKNFSVNNHWLPLIAFILVFIGSMSFIKLTAGFTEKLAIFFMIEWLNKLAGILVYLLLYISCYSIILFYLQQLQFIQPNTLQQSYSYAHLQNWGNYIIHNKELVQQNGLAFWQSIKNIFAR